jgi:hypothetical protein
MLDPVLLTEEILGQGRRWREDCVRRWGEASTFPRVGEVTMTSPVDGSRRRVVLYLDEVVYEGGRPVQGKTRVGVYVAPGNIEAGYTVALSSALIDPSDRHSLTRILLHELTHAVDPYFDADHFLQNPPGRPPVPLSSQEQYDLPSEQRAFTAMWTEEVREPVLTGGCLNPDSMMEVFRERCPAFDAFCRHGQWPRRDLADQTKEHIRRIAAHIQGPKSLG